MPTRKKVFTNGSQEHASPKFHGQKKKVTEIAEKKVKELITSVKKQKPAGIFSKDIIHVEDARDLHMAFTLAQDEDVLSVADETIKERPAECESNTIFSPAYHYSKENIDGGIDKVDFLKSFNNNSQSAQNIHGTECKSGTLYSEISLANQLGSIVTEMGVTVKTYDMNTDSTKKPTETAGSHNNNARLVYNSGSSQSNISSDDNKYHVVGNLSSEVSAIYLAMQHSKLECVDEHSEDSMSTEDCAEQDDSDEYDDFDPYTFIKDLPDLSAVVPKFRPALLPKQTRSCPSTTLVLDLDETLVHSSLEPCQDADFTFPVNFNLSAHTIYVRCRPHLKNFMERVASMFETTIFTASQSIYAEQLLNILDPKRKLIRHRVYRESCVYVDGNYMKDLSVLGRDLARVIIIDNSPQAFGFQLENGIPIESWFDDRNDKELLSLLPFLESLVGVDDVRPIIAKKFNLREKVTASSPSLFSLNLRR